MTYKNKELLSVLDMTNEEQYKWCIKQGLVQIECGICGIYESLADIAFRMRDEVIKKHMVMTHGYLVV